VWRRVFGLGLRAMCAPPLVDLPDLRLRLRRGPADSPTLSQFVDDRRPRTKPTSLRRLPGLGECVVQRAASTLTEIVALVVRPMT
jgi:hypothetical protein